jgi:hypothetical protein
MWPFNQKKTLTDYSDYVTSEMVLQASKLHLSTNEEVAVGFGLKLLNAGSVHPEATVLYKATIAGSLVAYAIYLIRNIDTLGLKTTEIGQVFDNAYSIYPHRGILAEKARFYGAINKLDKQKKIQAFLDSNPPSPTDKEELFNIAIGDVGRSLESVEVRSK